MNQQWLNKIHQGHVLNILKQMPSDLVDCVITSPPYWALRDYKNEPIVWDGNPNCEHEFDSIQRFHPSRGKRDGKGIYVDPKWTAKGSIKKEINSNFCSKCSAWRGSLGLEPTFELYIKHLCDILDEAKRVLKKTGTLWVNLGDTYAGSQSTNSSIKTANQINAHQTEAYREDAINKNVPGISNKSLCMIPYRFVIEMCNRGWILRNVIIWHKPNCMPSSAKDRFTVDFEPIFFFTKSKKYYFETQYEPHIYYDTDAKRKDFHKPSPTMDKHLEIGQVGKTRHGRPRSEDYNPLGRNKRAVWKISTKPFSEAHFAVYPAELVETPIRAGCPEDVCSKCGKPREKIRVRDVKEGRIKHIDRIASEEEIENYKEGVTHAGEGEKFTGYSSCSCNALFEPGIVLDPFMGSGTTGMVAKQLKRNWIGIELNKDYVQLANERVGGFKTKDWKAKKQHKIIFTIKSLSLY